MREPSLENARSRPGGGGLGDKYDKPWQAVEEEDSEALRDRQAARIVRRTNISKAPALILVDLNFARASLKAAQKPVSQDPWGWISDGQETVGLLFDARGGIVATSDRLPIGIFKDEKEGRRAIHKALRMRRAAA